MFTGDLADRGEPEAYRAAARDGRAVRRADRRPGGLVHGQPRRPCGVRPRALRRATRPPRCSTGSTTSTGCASCRSTRACPATTTARSATRSTSGSPSVLAEPAPHGTFLAMHHPPIPVPMLPAAAIIELDDQQRLAEALAGTDVRMILGGHFHYSSYSTFAGIPVSVASATCYLSDIAPTGPVHLGGRRRAVGQHGPRVRRRGRHLGRARRTTPPRSAATASTSRRWSRRCRFEERREMFSRKDSDFNRHEEDPIVGT